MNDEELLALAKKKGQEAEGTQVAPPGAPMRNSRWFIAGRYKGDLLVCQGGAFYAYNGKCWPLLDDRELRHQVYEDFGLAWYSSKADKVVAFNPTKSKVENIIDALKSITFSDSDSTVPKWLDNREDSANEIVVCQNGLVNVITRKLIPHNRAFFQHHAVPFDFEPEAPTPERWIKFLEELFGDDIKAIETLQEWMGYLMSADTRQQKMLLIVGPRRSGKGTVSHVVRAMLGSQNVVAPTLASLSKDFGLQPLIGKPVAIIPDARGIPTKSGSVITERLLSISGEDPLTVDRKQKDAWTVMFPTRIVILTNEVPRLNDAAGALASRFIVLTLRNSFFGKEDITLLDKLKSELPGIFNWTLEGLARLSSRGHFVQPESGAEAASQLRYLSSPIATFVDECCEVAPGLQVSKDELFSEWKGWCDRNGNMAGSMSVFAAKLYAAVPGIGQSKPRGQDQARVPHFTGIGGKF